MLFTSYKFGVLVVVAFAAYWTAGRLSRSRLPQNVVLLFFSYFFYALFDWRWCLLLLGVTVTGLLGGYLLDGWAAPAATGGAAGGPGPGRAPAAGAPRRARRRAVLSAVIVIDLLVLGLFKYFDFFAKAVASALGTSADQVTLRLVLPIGISYYIFQNLSYVIDVYRGDVSGRGAWGAGQGGAAARLGAAAGPGAAAGLIDYAVALSFFPQLLAGPITRPRHLLPQLAGRRSFDESLARDGLRQILWGLIKKMVIADNIGVLVDSGWGNIGGLDRSATVLVAVLYSFQIYCDFSGYADIAIGTGKLFGLRLSPNFARPYLSPSVREFWRRWHMTLASWMRDYVYIPLGGSRRGTPRRIINTLVTFLLVGLWHGASLTFVAWGLLHGVYLAVENVIDRARRPGAAVGQAASGGSAAGSAASGAGRPAAMLRGLVTGLVVFILVTIAWVFFRAPSLGAAIDFFGRAFTAPFFGAPHKLYLPWLAVGVALLVYERLTPSWEHGFAFPRVPRPVRWVIYLGACAVLLLLAQFGGEQGIYVQF